LIIHLIVNKDDLEAGNGIMYGTMQLSQLIGPASAGLLIARTNLPFAFTFDAATFIWASLTLILMRTNLVFTSTEARPESASPGGIHGMVLGRSGSLLTEIHDGLSYVIRHPLLGPLLGPVAAVHFAIDAPVLVGVTALASKRFIGAENLGLMLSAWGRGALLGALIAGALRTKDRGRAMSVVMLASAGIVPFSYALAGWLADVNLTLMFIIAGAIILFTIISAGRNRALRAI